MKKRMNAAIGGVMVTCNICNDKEYFKNETDYKEINKQLKLKGWTVTNKELGYLDICPNCYTLHKLRTGGA